MRSVEVLPEGYAEIYRLDLQNDKRTALTVNLMCAGISVVLVIIGCLIVPLSELFDLDSEPAEYFIRLAVLIVGMVTYMLLHELVHGIFIRYFSGVRPKYGFTGMYAYAGSNAYFGKKPYIIIALAPVVIWGVVLAVLNVFISGGAWFWIVYLIQVTNLGGAAGDIYVTHKFSKMPEDILVQDVGVAMKVYSDCK